ncbi:MAG: HD domain-containing protein [Gemmatimonadaceae bacterium]|nr:HD domain-containing protein [Gemmatimonadaceae bacterium]
MSIAGQRLALVSLVVPEYDEAVAYYTSVLGLRLVQDEPQGDGKRWVVVAPAGAPAGGAALLLARAATPEQASRVGNQTGGRVFLFLHTADFAADYARYAAAGVEFLSEPRDEPYGRVAVFRDRYGTKWDLIEPRVATPLAHEAAGLEAHADALLAFLTECERLKTALRSGWTSAGRRESVAEHTWRLMMLALVIHPSVPEADLFRVLKICLVHDLGEAIGGDVPAPEQAARGGVKGTDERRDLQTLIAPLPAALATEILALWDEYEAASTAEARLAKALDKLETILQHTQGDNPMDFDYRFNLHYGRRYTEAPPIVAALRARLDAATEARAHAQESA